MNKSYLYSSCIFLSFIVIALWWWPALNAGYLLEDSWFLHYQKFSLVEIIRCFIEPRDFLGYYRPIRNTFLMLSSILFGLNQPFYPHLFIFLVFFGLIVALLAFYRRLMPPWMALLALLTFALSNVHLKPLIWLSATHNIFAAFFCALALIYRLHDSRMKSAAFFALALASRESSLGMLAALFWIEYLRLPSVPKVRKLFSRTYDLLIVASIFTVIFLWAPPVETSEPHIHTNLPIWMNHWVGYLLVFIWPKFYDYKFSVLSIPLPILFLSFLLSGLFLYHFTKQIINRQLSAIFGLVYLGGISLHLIYTSHWHPEYASLAAIGFYGFWAQWIGEMSSKKWVYRLSVTAALCICISVAIPYHYKIIRNYSQLWKTTNGWVYGLNELLLRLKPNEIPVIENVQHSQAGKVILDEIIFLPQYVRLKFPQKIILWNPSDNSVINRSYGLDFRSIRFAQPNRRLNGATLLFVQENHLTWIILRKEKIPYPKAQ